MIDLLVSSFMTDGRPKTSLEVKEKELEETEDKVGLDKPGDTLMTEHAQLESETKRAAEHSNTLTMPRSLTNQNTAQHACYFMLTYHNAGIRQHL